MMKVTNTPRSDCFKSQGTHKGHDVIIFMGAHSRNMYFHKAYIRGPGRRQYLKKINIP